MALNGDTSANAGTIVDLGFNPTTAAGEAIARHLERRVKSILDQVIESEVGQAVIARQLDPHLVRAILREIYLEIVMYQPDAIEAAIASIGQNPRPLV